MTARVASVIGLMLFCPAAAPASAQEPGDKGLTISAPSSIGFIWHLSPALAIRPEMSFALSGTETGNPAGDADSHGFTLAGSGLVYAGHWDNLRTYFSPRLSYSWVSTTLQGTTLQGSTSTVESTSNSWTVAGSLGAQYSLGSRFAVFAEAGLQYGSQRSETPFLSSTNERTTWTFGSRTEIGATLYF